MDEVFPYPHHSSSNSMRFYRLSPASAEANTMPKVATVTANTQAAEGNCENSLLVSTAWCTRILHRLVLLASHRRTVKRLRQRAACPRKEFRICSMLERPILIHPSVYLFVSKLQGQPALADPQVVSLWLLFSTLEPLAKQSEQFPILDTVSHMFQPY